MKLLKISFDILQMSGFWRPPEWTGLKKWLYNLYTLLMIYTLYSVTFTQLIELLRSIENVDEFINNSLILLTTTNACVKVFNILRNRDEILKMINSLLTNPCCPRDDDERMIQHKYDMGIKWNSIMYAVLTELSVFGVNMGSVLEDIPKRTLAYKTWLPYDYNKSELIYWMTYINQLIADALGSFVNISYDTLVPGCMMQTCAQFEIFKHRLNKLCNIPHSIDTISQKSTTNLLSNEKTQQIIEQKIVADCVQHHLNIFELKTANNIFAYSIFFQYSVSLVVICASVYGLSNVDPFTTEFTYIIVYLICMTVQIYIFCFYGTIVTHKSINLSDNIHGMDWAALSIPTKKSLLIIMTRTSRPIQFTSGHIVVLCLDSFNKLLKLSYSAYNVLQQTG
ncbi:hypothetical protein PV326_008760 [Microctonus aethiopoides]|nr:hypothetical protein PV326_008760 [Microctonus aethiopoides]